MKTLSVANQKGGVGKTTILFHLAMFLTRTGKRTLVIDLDQQANATKTFQLAKNIDANIQEIPVESHHLLTKQVSPEPFEDRPDMSGPFLCPSSPALYNVELESDVRVLGQTFNENIKIIKGKLKRPFDYCLIDCAPVISGKMGAALGASDFVVSPVELQLYALDGMGMMLNTINQYQKVNKKLNFLGMIPNKIRQEHHRETMAQLARQYPGFVIPCPIGYRDSLDEAVTKGVPVWKIRKTAARTAAKEMIALGEHILKLMEKTSNG